MTLCNILCLTLCSVPLLCVPLHLYPFTSVHLYLRLQSAEQVRDFVVEKLKGAERALRSSMTEADSLKKQAIVDQEVRGRGS